MTEPLDIIAVNRSECKALLSDGQLLEMTDFYLGGEETDAESADTAVAGPDIEGQWYTIYLNEFVPEAREMMH